MERQQDGFLKEREAIKEHNHDLEGMNLRQAMRIHDLEHELDKKTWSVKGRVGNTDIDCGGTLTGEAKAPKELMSPRSYMGQFAATRREEQAARHGSTEGIHDDVRAILRHMENHTAASLGMAGNQRAMFAAMEQRLNGQRPEQRASQQAIDDAVDTLVVLGLDRQDAKAKIATMLAT